MKQFFLFLKNVFHKKSNLYSLKDEITRSFILSSLVTFVLLSSVSYYTIYSILYNRIHKGIDSTLDQNVKELNLTFDNLMSVSQQLSYEGPAAKDLANFLSTSSYAEKRGYYDSINAYLNLIDYTNPNVGLHCYYDRKSGEILFANDDLSSKFNVSKLPKLMQKAAFSFYGPHISSSMDKSGYVLSVSSPIKIIDGVDYSLYIETNSNTLSDILKRNQLGMNMYYTITNDKGEVTYTEMQDYFPVGSTYKYEAKTDKMVSKGRYYVFTKKSTSGWMLSAALKKSSFNMEIRQWLFGMIFIGILLLFVGFAVGFVIWRSVYESIEVFKNEINLVADNNFDSELTYTNIQEFDGILDEFYSMKQKIGQLMIEIKQKEKDKYNLEVDKLLYQINPHFLYNTLNIVQWMAKSEGNKDIVKFVTNLVRLLRYNLGKEGFMVTIEREIDALKDYVSLQQVRSDYKLDVIFNIDEKTLKVLIPRFILQPLVENSIYHGLNGYDGCIWVNISYVTPDKIGIIVKDNGQGMSKDIIDELLEGKDSRHGELGLGIGLNYVDKVLRVSYGDEYKLSIESEIGAGTTYRFNIPANKGGKG